MKKVIFILLLVTAHNAFSQSAGVVLFTAKKVTAQQKGAEHTLTRGSSLESGDTIVTAADATAKIRYSNGTLVTIGPGSNYHILAYSPNQSEVVIKAELTKGKIESETTGGIKREALKTPVVALAISGTKYKVFVSDQKKTYVQLITGSVKVGDTNIRPGESVVATTDGVRPASFPAAGNIVNLPGMANAQDASSTTSTNSTSANNATSTNSTSANNATSTNSTSANNATSTNNTSANNDTSTNSTSADNDTSTNSTSADNDTPTTSTSADNDTSTTSTSADNDTSTTSTSADNDTSTNSTSADNDTSTDITSADNDENIEASGVSETSFVTTTVVAGQSASATAATVATVGLATIDLACITPTP